jgi:hypothetical protein
MVLVGIKMQIIHLTAALSSLYNFLFNEGIWKGGAKENVLS